MDLASSTEIELDLGELEGLSASALAVLVATLRKVHAQGFCNPIDHFTPPKARDLCECLSHERLRALLNGDRLSVYHSNAAAKVDICACEAFSDSEDVAHAVNDILEHLVDRHRLGERTLHAVNCLLSDATQNVLQHADSGGGAIAVKMYRDRGVLELAVADRGIGIRRSLTKNKAFEALSDDADALRKALAPSCTSTPGKGRGMGLYQSKLIFAGNGGTLTVRSGSAQLATPRRHAMWVRYRASPARSSSPQPIPTGRSTSASSRNCPSASADCRRSSESPIHGSIEQARQAPTRARGLSPARRPGADGISRLRSSRSCSRLDR